MAQRSGAAFGVLLVIPLLAAGMTAGGPVGDARSVSVVASAKHARSDGARPSPSTDVDAERRVLAPCPRIGAQPTDRIGARGIVYRRYGGYGYRFQPLASFARLDGLVNARSQRCVATLAAALLRRAVAWHGALYWEYDFPYGGPAPWTSGFVQAVAAQALARAGRLLADRNLIGAARRSFAGLRRTLLMPLGGGLWVREYSFTSAAILNAQLESMLSVESYAAVVQAPRAFRTADRMRRAAANLLPQFDLGCWGRYELGGAAASEHYQRYHVLLLRRLAAAHPEEPIWRETFVAWRRCLR